MSPLLFLHLKLMDIWIRKRYIWCTIVQYINGEQTNVFLNVHLIFSNCEDHFIVYFFLLRKKYIYWKLKHNNYTYSRYTFFCQKTLVKKYIIQIKYYILNWQPKYVAYVCDVNTWLCLGGFKKTKIYTQNTRTLWI